MFPTVFCKNPCSVAGFILLIWRLSFYVRTHIKGCKNRPNWSKCCRVLLGLTGPFIIGRDQICTDCGIEALCKSSQLILMRIVRTSGGIWCIACRVECQGLQQAKRAKMIPPLLLLCLLAGIDSSSDSSAGNSLVLVRLISYWVHTSTIIFDLETRLRYFHIM